MIRVKLITMIVQHNRRIIRHYKDVLNALEMDALSKVLPKLSSMFKAIFLKDLIPGLTCSY